MWSNMPDENIDDTLSEGEIEARSQAALKRMLSTPPKPHKSAKESSPKDVPKDKKPD